MYKHITLQSLEADMAVDDVGPNRNHKKDLEFCEWILDHMDYISPETTSSITPDIFSDFEGKYQQYQVNITLQKNERAQKTEKSSIYSSRGRKISYSSTEG